MLQTCPTNKRKCYDKQKKLFHHSLIFLKKMNGQKQTISSIITQALHFKSMKNSFFSCLLSEPYRVRVLYGKNSERTKLFVGNLSSTLVKENIFSECSSVRYVEPSTCYSSHDAAHEWLLQRMGMQFFNDSCNRCLFVVHNVDGIENYVDLSIFMNVMNSYQYFNGCLFLMTTSKKETYDALLKANDYLTERQMAKPLIYRV